MIEVNLQYSRYLLLLLLTCTALSVAGLWFCQLPVFVKSAIGFALCCYVWLYHDRYIKLDHKSSIKVARLINNQWRVLIGNSWHRAWPEGEVIVTSFLMCSRMKVDRQRCPAYLILLPDSASASELHSLRLKLMIDSHHCL